tara:strand:- start:2200 stop:2763 length:564 start_codon:yes stop_codon:yes gene_type:complete
MPFYEFKCSGCGMRSEALMKVSEACEDGQFWECGSEEVIDKFFDPHGDRLKGGCGGKIYKQISCPARTPSLWGDETGAYGVNGYFSQALGKYCSRKDERRIMEQRGFIPESDMPSGFFESETEKRKEIAKAKNKDVNEIQKLQEDGMEKGEAIAKVFSAERALSGDLDKTWGGTHQSDGPSTKTPPA